MSYFILIGHKKGELPHLVTRGIAAIPAIFDYFGEANDHAEYLKRTSPGWQVEVVELEDEP